MRKDGLSRSNSEGQQTRHRAAEIDSGCDVGTETTEQVLTTIMIEATSGLKRFAVVAARASCHCQSSSSLRAFPMPFAIIDWRNRGNSRDVKTPPAVPFVFDDDSNYCYSAKEARRTNKRRVKNGNCSTELGKAGSVCGTRAVVLSNRS